MSLSTLLPAKAIYKQFKKERKEMKSLLESGIEHGSEPMTRDEAKAFIDERMEQWEENFFNNMEKEQEAIARIHVRMRNIVKPILEAEDPEIKPVRATYFITINPKPDVIFEDFKLMVDKYLKSKSLLAYEAAFEQKGKEYDTLGHNFHVHILAKGKPTLRFDHVKTTIQNLFGDSIGENQPDIQIIKKIADIRTRQAYIRDAKLESEDKRTAHIMDKMWRERLNIEELYTMNEVY